MMYHFPILVDIIIKHRDKYNEYKRLSRQLSSIRKTRFFADIDSSDYRKILIDRNSFEHSDPRFLNNKDVSIFEPNYVAVEHVIKDKKRIAEYRKWCKTAARYRRVKRECHALLCAMREIGKLYGTKVQTTSSDGNSFNRPFYIHIGDKKFKINDFLNDQAFEEIILKEKT